MALVVVVALCVMFYDSKTMFTRKNAEVSMKNINFSATFNDKNAAHLKAAKEIGLKEPLHTRDDADAAKRKLVKIEDNSLYILDELTHSVPYLTKGAANLLEMIGRDFQDSLESKGLNPNRLVVTSVTRTEEDVAKLRKSGNVNASSNSAHCYATTFDIAYARFDKIDYKFFRYCEPVDPAILKRVLADVLINLQNEKMCYVKYEVKQGCFHITSRM